MELKTLNVVLKDFFKFKIAFFGLFVSLPRSFINTRTGSMFKFNLCLRHLQYYFCEVYLAEHLFLNIIIL